MLAKPHVSFPWFSLFCLLCSLFILSLFSSSPQQLPVSKILASGVWQGPWMLSFVLNPSRVLHPQEAEQKFLLASWPWHEFCMLVDICFCDEGLPFNLLQCRSSLYCSLDWWNPLRFLHLENQFLYQWKAGLASKHQTLIYVAISSIFLFIFYSWFHRHLFWRFSGQASGLQLLWSSLFCLKYWCCIAVL